MSYSCKHCYKEYKQQKAWSKHEAKCELIHTKKYCSTLEILVQQLLEKQNKLINKVDALEKKVYRDVKKINIVEWLDNNVTMNITFDKWLEMDINVTVEDLLIIYKNNYEVGVNQILERNIERKKDNIPIRAFFHKKGQLYIYKNKWMRIDKKDIAKIFDKLYNNIQKSCMQYEEILINKKKDITIINQKITDPIFKKDLWENKTKKKL